MPVCVIRLISIRLVRFCDVTEEFARKEGEGDLSLEYWRKEHHRFFTREGYFSDCSGQQKPHLTSLSVQLFGCSSLMAVSLWNYTVVLASRAAKPIKNIPTKAFPMADSLRLPFRRLSK